MRLTSNNLSITILTKWDCFEAHEHVKHTKPPTVRYRRYRYGTSRKNPDFENAIPAGKYHIETPGLGKCGKSRTYTYVCYTFKLCRYLSTEDLRI